MGKVNRCICSNITFQEIQTIAKEEGLTSVEQLQAHGICSCNCMLCAPFITRMLKTGKTEFEPGEIQKPRSRHA